MWGKILVSLSPGRTEHRIKEINIHRGCKGEMVTEICRMDSFSVMVLLTAILEQELFKIQKTITKNIHKWHKGSFSILSQNTTASLSASNFMLNIESS